MSHGSPRNWLVLGLGQFPHEEVEYHVAFSAQG